MICHSDMKQISFTMHGRPSKVIAYKDFTQQEFLAMLYYTRRLIGYVVYPRWCACRLLLAETIEMMRRNGIYRQRLKRVTMLALREFDKFESFHQRDFDLEFISLIGDGLAAQSLPVVNELRGAIGSEMMHAGVERYILLSYPYTVLDLAYDNTVQYNKAMDAVKFKYGVDFTPTFKKYKGEKLYSALEVFMDTFLDSVREQMPRISWEGTLAQQKLEKFEKFIIDEHNIHEAFKEAYTELPDDKKPALEATMSIWDSDADEDTTEIMTEPRKMAERLGEKYKVTQIKDKRNYVKHRALGPEVQEIRKQEG